MLNPPPPGGLCSPKPLTKGAFRLNEAHGERLGLGHLPQHLGNFIMAASHDGLVVDGLDAVPDTDCRDPVDDAAFLDALQGVSLQGAGKKVRNTGGETGFRQVASSRLGKFLGI